MRTWRNRLRPGAGQRSRSGASPGDTLIRPTFLADHAIPSPRRWRHCDLRSRAMLAASLVRHVGHFRLVRQWCQNNNEVRNLASTSLEDAEPITAALALCLRCPTPPEAPGAASAPDPYPPDLLGSCRVLASGAQDSLKPHLRDLAGSHEGLPGPGMGLGAGGPSGVTSELDRCVGFVWLSPVTRQRPRLQVPNPPFLALVAG